MVFFNIAQRRLLLAVCIAFRNVWMNFIKNLKKNIRRAGGLYCYTTNEQTNIVANEILQSERTMFCRVLRSPHWLRVQCYAAHYKAKASGLAIAAVYLVGLIVIIGRRRLWMFCFVQCIKYLRWFIRRNGIFMVIMI